MSVPTNLLNGLLGSADTATPAVTDFSQFAALRNAAAKDDPQALHKTAQQFESLFTQMLLKSMHATKFGDDLTGEQGDFYQDIFDQQLALHLSTGKGLGLADALEHQLGGKAAAAARSYAVGAATAPAVGSSETQATSAADDTNWQPKTPAEFVAAIKPHAERAAAELGVPTQAIVAQAALETGWGQHLPRDAQGRTSFNLFGIKAQGGWTGDRVVQGTAEYENGDWGRETASFRRYQSLAESFDDYVRFLKNNPRYADALRADDVHGFARGLQSAGYATDPQYAEKLVRVAYSPEVRAAAHTPRRFSA